MYQPNAELQAANATNPTSSPISKANPKRGTSAIPDRALQRAAISLESGFNDILELSPNAKLTGRTEPACRRSGLQRGVKFAKQMPRCKLSG
jgi:hypothetical protein